MDHSRRLILGEVFAALSLKLHELDSRHDLSNAEKVSVLLMMAKELSDRVISDIEHMEESHAEDMAGADW